MIYCAAYKRGEQRAGPIHSEPSQEVSSLKSTEESMIYCGQYGNSEGLGVDSDTWQQQGASQADHHKLPNDMVYCAAYGNGKGGRSTTNVPCVENIAYGCTISGTDTN